MGSRIRPDRPVRTSMELRGSVGCGRLAVQAVRSSAGLSEACRLGGEPPRVGAGRLKLFPECRRLPRKGDRLPAVAGARLVSAG